MPKTKKTKTKYMSYDKENLALAVRDVKEYGKSIRKAAIEYGVPKSTLMDQISGRSDANSRPGRKPALPESVEQGIVDAVKEASRIGVGVTRSQLLSRTGEICRRLRTTPFKHAYPTKDWWAGVKKRHPELTIRKPESLAASRASMLNPVVVTKYFKDLETLMNDNDLMNKPNVIWNCDETNRSFNHNPPKVIADKSMRNVVGRSSNNRTTVTIMACVNAEGTAMPPMFIAKGKTTQSLHGFQVDSAPKGSQWTYQENGYMTDKIGEEWFRNIFLKHCGDHRPQLLILDGHSSHESFAVLQLAMQNNIQIMCLPPHTTHILQPLDRSVFGPFSASYNRACADHMASPLNTVCKWSFSGLINIAWEKALTASNIQSGFRACGIYPFNPKVVEVINFAPSKLTDAPASEVATTASESTSPTAVEKECTTRDSIDAKSPSFALGSPDQTGMDSMLPIVDSGPDNVDDNPNAPFLLDDSLSFSEVPVAEGVSEVVTVDQHSFSLPALMTDVLSSSQFTPVDDPELLLNLLQEGKLTVDVADDPTPTTSSIPDNIWNIEIQHIMLPQKVGMSSEKKGKTRNTSHRILTSVDVLKEKEEALLRKQQREEEKKQRAAMREMKKQKK